ncbi:MAG: AAA family ATPase [Synechocystis sp.]
MLKSIKVQNFKAIQNSKTIKLTPLTVFIGNNGSGKSSVIEALETYKTIIESNLDTAMRPWRGFEYVRNQGIPHTTQNAIGDRPYESNPIEFNLLWPNYRATMNITSSPGGNELFIQKEQIEIKGKPVTRRSSNGEVLYLDREDENKITLHLPDDLSCISSFSDSELKIDLYEKITRWQFLNLNPYAMVNPTPRKRSGGQIHLAKDGSNIAEYLLSIQLQNPSAFSGIIEALQYVLPYAHDLQPTITSELERSVYLQLTEANFKVPSWLFSTGTLRILALLAVLRHPTPPPLIVLEEIENGLDPRTIHLIVEEIRNVVESGRSQIIVTTHSPYLLDLLTLSHIVMVERNSRGEPIFTRPADQESLQEWAEQFSLGKLYTMGQLNQEETA